MPGSIRAPNSGSFVEKNKKNIGSQMGQTDKKKFKKTGLGQLLQFASDFITLLRQLI
jgi:hypothetical protein